MTRAFLRSTDEEQTTDLSRHLPSPLLIIHKNSNLVYVGMIPAFVVIVIQQPHGPEATKVNRK